MQSLSRSAPGHPPGPDGQGLPLTAQRLFPRVLVVDDEPAVLDGLRRQLSPAFAVSTAEGAEEALDLMDSVEPFAAVVSDMCMPGMDGAAFLARVRKLYPDTVRLVLTGRADIQSTAAAINDGQIYRFLSKPCSSDAIATALRDSVALYNSITANREASQAGAVSASPFSGLPVDFAARAQERRTVSELEMGLRERQVVAFYQPQVDLRTGMTLGVEALARWQHPKLGLIPPSAFVPPAERSGLIVSLDHYILQEATRQLGLWRHQGLALSMAVNVSGRTLACPSLIGDVRTALSENAINADALQLEITETAIIADVDGVAKNIADLRELGVKIAIDDFGAGESSLSYLHKFDIDIVKIDRGFVTALVEGPKVSELVGGLISLFQSLGMSVVCEGVAEAVQCAELQTLDCRVAQGFYFAKPGPADAVGRWLHATESQCRTPPTK